MSTLPETLTVAGIELRHQRRGARDCYIGQAAQSALRVRVQGLADSDREPYWEGVANVSHDIAGRRDVLTFPAVAASSPEEAAELLDEVVRSIAGVLAQAVRS